MASIHLTAFHLHISTSNRRRLLAVDKPPSFRQATVIHFYQSITQPSIKQQMESEEIESRLLREKAQVILNNVLEAEDDSVKALKMAELNQVLDRPCFKEEHVESLNDTFKSVLRFLDDWPVIRH